MQLLFEIAEHENLKLKNFQRLAGGDINAVFLLVTSTEKYVIKLNDKSAFPNLFQEEALALEALAKTNSFRIPNVICTGACKNQSYLIMEYIETGTEKKSFWEDFGIHLAELHGNTNNHFGWESQNYIGSLQQYNNLCTNSADFYISKRLQPQLKQAQEKGFTFQHLDDFYANVAAFIPKGEKPALIHGDLWSGNYMIDANHKPVLIDPAICFASREMDLAMMQLFGGFPNRVFEVYQEYFPLPSDWKSRIELYQLYYLLVHLNLFGSSYLNRVQQIIKGYA